jgi:hypothetical protein
MLSSSEHVLLLYRGRTCGAWQPADAIRRLTGAHPVSLQDWAGKPVHQSKSTRCHGIYETIFYCYDYKGTRGPARKSAACFRLSKGASTRPSMAARHEGDTSERWSRTRSMAWRTPRSSIQLYPTQKHMISHCWGAHHKAQPRRPTLNPSARALPGAGRAECDELSSRFGSSPRNLI